MAINSHHLLFFCSLVQTRVDLLWSPSLFFNDLGISFGLNPFKLKEGRDATNTSSQLSLLLTCWSTGCELNGAFTRVSKYGTASLFWPEASPPVRIRTNNVLHLTCDVTIKQPINATEAEKSRVALLNSQLDVERNTFRSTKQQPGTEILSDNFRWLRPRKMPKAFLVKKKTEKLKKLPSNVIIAGRGSGEWNNLLCLLRCTCYRYQTGSEERERILHF